MAAGVARAWLVVAGATYVCRLDATGDVTTCVGGGTVGLVSAGTVGLVSGGNVLCFNYVGFGHTASDGQVQCVISMDAEARWLTAVTHAHVSGKQHTHTCISLFFYHTRIT